MSSSLVTRLARGQARLDAKNWTVTPQSYGSGTAWPCHGTCYARPKLWCLARLALPICDPSHVESLKGVKSVGSQSGPRIAVTRRAEAFTLVEVLVALLVLVTITVAYYLGI